MTDKADIQSLIDSKVALISNLISTLQTIIALPKASYSIDGQEVSWSEYYAMLTNSQKTEVESLMKLYELMNIIKPYMFISRGI